MGLDSSSLGDSTVAAGDRVKAAGLKMDEYFDQLIQGKSRLRPLPCALATLLREQMPYKVYDAGVARALELAQAIEAGRRHHQGRAEPCARRRAGRRSPAPRRPAATAPAPKPARPAATAAPRSRSSAGRRKER